MEVTAGVGLQQWVQTLVTWGYLRGRKWLG